MPLSSGATDNPNAAQSGVPEQPMARDAEGNTYMHDGSNWVNTKTQQPYTAPQEQGTVRGAGQIAKDASGKSYTQDESGNWVDIVSRKPYQSPDSTPAEPGAPKSTWDKAKDIVGRFGERLAQSVGVPTSSEQLKAAQPSTIAKASPGIGQLGSMLWNAGKQAIQGGKEGIQEAQEAGRNIAGGGPVLSNLGKAMYGGAHAMLQSVPLVGAPTETAGQDIHTGNIAGAAGGLTGVVGQVAVPEVAHDVFPGETTAYSEAANRVKAQQEYVKPLQKALDAAQKEHDSYGASKTAGVPIPEKVVSKLEKAKSALLEQQKHLDLAEQAAANAKAGRPNVPNTAEPAAGLGNIKQAAARPAPASGEALGGSALRNPLGDIHTPSAVPARESGEALATVKPTKAGELGSMITPKARPASATGEALGSMRVPDREITPAEVKSSPGTSMSPEGRPEPNKMAGTKEGAEQDTAMFQKAKAELGPDASISQVAQRAQEMKAEASKVKTPYTGEERRETPREKPLSSTELEASIKQRKPAQTPFDVTEGARETMERDPEMAKLAPNATKPIAEVDPKELADYHNTNRGFTYNGEKGFMKDQPGFSVAGEHPELEKVIPGQKITPEAIKDYVNDPKVKEALKDPKNSVGGWFYKGNSHLEISKLFDNKDEAMAEGKRLNQVEIYDHANHKGIETGGTGGIEEAKAVAEEPKEETNKEPKESTQAKAEVPSEDDTLRAVKLVKDHGDQNLIKAASQYGIDHAGYDFSKRTEPTATSSGRARYEREALVKDVAEKMEKDKPGITDELLKAQDQFDNKDSGVFSSADRSGASRAERAKLVWDKAHENWEKKYGEGKEPTKTGPKETKGSEGKTEEDLTPALEKSVEEAKAKRRIKK
jgi:hypothetical protein